MKRIVFASLGYTFLGLGVIGIAIPIFPTTPFIILSAGCFTQGNPKIHNWLRNSKFFGEYIENYKSKKGIRKSTKIFSILFLWFMIVLSILINRQVYVDMLLLVVAILVTIHILMLNNMTRNGVLNDERDKKY